MRRDSTDMESESLAGKSIDSRTALLSGLLRPGHLKIGTRLTWSFIAIVLAMLVANLVAVWQFRRTTAPSQLLNEADQLSLAVMTVHIDVDTLGNRLAALADVNNGPTLLKESASLRSKFLADVTYAQQLYTRTRDTKHEPVILSALQTLKVTLPSQIEKVERLAEANDWPAVRLRLADQVQGLMDLSALLLERVEAEVSRQRAEAFESTQRVSRQLLMVLPLTALLTMLLAILLGWRLTRTITEPLAELHAAAQALAQGNFEQQVNITGDDELATVARAFNYAAQRLRESYDELRNREEALRRSEKELRDVIESIPAMVWSTLPDGAVDFINRRWQDLTGLPPEDALGWQWAAAVHPDDRGGYLAEWRAALTNKQKMETEVRAMQADGEYRWLMVRNVPLWDESSNIFKWYGVATDVDDRKKVEQERERRRRAEEEREALRQLASEARLNERMRIARELHDTLLQSVQGLMISFQAARNLLPGRTEEAIRTLDRSIRAGDEAIAEGRDAIRGLRADAALESNLEHLLTAAGEELARSSSVGAEPPAFRVIVKGARRPLSPLLQDEVYKIGLEIMRNAFRHARASRIEVEMTFDSESFRLRIRDDGRGIDRKVQEEGARQGHWGLPGVRERAERIGARLKLWSEPAAGTEADVTVPARIAYERAKGHVLNE